MNEIPNKTFILNSHWYFSCSADYQKICKKFFSYCVCCVEVEEIKRSLSAVRLNVEQMRHYLFQFTASMAAVLYSTLIKKKIEFSSCIRKFRWEQLQSQCWTLPLPVHRLHGRGIVQYTDKKEHQIFLIYKEIQMGAVAKSVLDTTSSSSPPPWPRYCTVH